jgi:hypothetical protein
MTARLTIRVFDKEMDNEHTDTNKVLSPELQT